MIEFESYLSELRVKPKNAQNEPPYSVVFAMTAPGMTAHLPTTLCSIESPHAIAECREWTSDYSREQK